MKPFISLHSIKRRSNHLRMHLANRCTEQMEIKCRCSQTQLESLGLDAEMLSVVPEEGALAARDTGYVLPL